MKATVREAARFVLLSLDRTRSRDTDAEYLALHDRFQNELEFRDAATAIAQGLSLTPVDVTASSWLLIPQPDSPFEEDVRTYRTNDQKELLDALALIAVVATAYPRPEYLDDSSLRRFSLEDVVDHLDQLVTTIQQREGRDTDADAEPDAWRLLDRLSKHAKSTNAPSLETYVKRAVNKLEEHRLLMANRSKDGQYFTTDELRGHAREVIATRLYQEVTRA